MSRTAHALQPVKRQAPHWFIDAATGTTGTGIARDTYGATTAIMTRRITAITVIRIPIITVAMDRASMGAMDPASASISVTVAVGDGIGGSR